MGVDHSNTITVSIILSALPPARAGFGTALFIVDEDDGNTLGGVRVVSYANAAEAETAQAAGEISATTLGVLQDAFAQVPTPSKIKVGFHDSGAPETLTAALAAIEALDTDWYGVALYSRLDADILEMAGLMETRKKILIVQSDDADWITTGLPAGLSTLAALERTAVVYHDTDAEGQDLAWLASRLVFDPDVQSAGWEGQVRGASGLATGLTSAQRDFIVANNANVGLPFSSAPIYISPGVNCAGRGIYEIVSADWFAARVSEDVALLKLEHTARGEKILVDATGQAKIMAILSARLQQGEAAGHFVTGQTRATAEAITPTDTSTKKLRFKVEAQIGQDARLFDFNVYLQTDPLQEA